MAEIVGVHGIKGFVKLKVFSDDPEGLAEGPPLCDSTGKTSYTLLSIKPHGNIWLSEIEGVEDRTAAEKLRGTKLYLSREHLPEIEDKKTFYHADLIGMIAKDAKDNVIGKVIAVVNFGAGDLLEIKPVKGDSFYLPFSERAVPVVDLDNRQMTVDIPHGLLD